VVDVVNVIRSFIDDQSIDAGYEIYNVGGDESIGIHELGVLIGKLLNRTPRFEFVDGDEPGGWIANNSKLKARLTLNPFIDIESGLKKVLMNESEDVPFR
jgi:nucleoside-diphosphate-sugar epimerase